MSTQHLPADHHIIGLVGHAGAGKDTAAEYLVEHFGFSAVSFAAPLKNMLEALFEDAGVDHAWLHEPHLKGELDVFNKEFALFLFLIFTLDTIVL